MQACKQSKECFLRVNKTIMFGTNKKKGCHLKVSVKNENCMKFSKKQIYDFWKSGHSFILPLQEYKNKGIIMYKINFLILVI